MPLFNIKPAQQTKSRKIKLGILPQKTFFKFVSLRDGLMYKVSHDWYICIGRVGICSINSENEGFEVEPFRVNIDFSPATDEEVKSLFEV